MSYTTFGEMKSYIKSKSMPKPKYTIGGLSSDPIESKMVENCKISIVKNDLTVEKVDAIVNAANNFLAHGAGVAGAICRKGGYSIQKQSDEIIKYKRKIRNGESVTTEAGKLDCKYVIHTVGPIWDDGESQEKEELAECVTTIFREAKQRGVKSISIPAVSSGIFGFPKDLCAKILIDEADRLLSTKQYPDLKEVRFCNFDNETVSEFIQAFINKYRPERNEPEVQKQENQKEGNEHPKEEKKVDEDDGPVQLLKDKEQMDIDHGNKQTHSGSGVQEDDYSLKDQKQDDNIRQGVENLNLDKKNSKEDQQGSPKQEQTNKNDKFTESL